MQTFHRQYLLPFFFHFHWLFDAVNAFRKRFTLTNKSFMSGDSKFNSENTCYTCNWFRSYLKWKKTTKFHSWSSLWLLRCNLWYPTGIHSGTFVIYCLLINWSSRLQSFHKTQNVRSWYHTYLISRRLSCSQTKNELWYESNTIMAFCQHFAGVNVKKTKFMPIGIQYNYGFLPTN